MTRAPRAQGGPTSAALRLSWLGVRDDFRNWVSLGFQPAKRNENL
jgi:hypothetical protein